ncbi:MAG TPA: complex I NDUFA9 subunit family protein [Caulobacteraceae bacterium]|nr:complex I NDUFA9 subunit family protein [Caulobacteraceae bacterium]
MRGLVTVFGGSGFIGSQTVRALAKQGWRIRVAVRRPWQAYRQRLLGDVGQIEIVQANVRFAETVERALDGAEAAVLAVGTPFEYGAQSFQAVRAEGSRTVAEAAAGRGIANFAFVSGIGADARSASRAGRAVAEAETAVRQAIPTATILRPSVVFGPEDRFFNQLAAMAVASPVMPVFSQATRLQPVFVADVARAVAAALHDPATDGRTYELGGPGVYTMRELVEITLAEIARPRPILPLPDGLAALIGLGGDVLAFLHGPLPMLLKPPITTDQIAMLKADNVVSPGAAGLADLGVTPQALEPIIPTYLYTYRPGGQYADLAPPEPIRGTP